MIRQKEIIIASQKLGIPKSSIDKDWILGHTLNAMYSLDEVREYFVFKGGTCLRKCFAEDYRFSEDLDFTLINENILIDSKLITRIIKIVEHNCGARMHIESIGNKRSEDIEQGFDVIIRFWGADHKINQKPLPPLRWHTSIKLDICFSERIVLKPEEKKIFHPYSDQSAIINTAIVYNLNEIVAEKLRALIQRNRPRDIYDNWFFSTYLHDSQYSEIKEILVVKALDKNIRISDFKQFVNEDKRQINKQHWQNSLGHQIPKDKLPDFDNAYIQLESFIQEILNS